MFFEYSEIQIKFDTNFQEKEIDFNLDILYNETINDKKKGLNKLPYFTLDYKISLATLSDKSYQECIEFFFDDKIFKETLLGNGEKIKYEELENPTERNNLLMEVAENNVMVMIELLFPTKFNVINNFHTSYDHVLENSSLKRMLIDPFKEKKYSYLKLSDNKIYTFTKLTWINDLLNHPLYKKIFKYVNTNKNINGIPSDIYNLKSPRRETINEDLQNIINKIKTQNINNEIIKQIYNVFLLGKKKIHYANSNVSEKEQEDKEEQEQKELKKLLNTSICKININNKMKYEIYIMVDFIQGKVDDTNLKNIYCPYVGEYLGNLFEILFSSQLYGKTNDNDIYRWYLNKNRFKFSIENNNEFDNKYIEKEVKKMDNYKSSDNYKNSDDYSDNYKKLDEINSLFINDIDIISKKNTELKKILKELNIETSELLLKLNDNKSNVFNKKLFDIIIKIYNNNLKNKELLNSINKIKNEYLSNIENNEREIEEIKSDESNNITNRDYKLNKLNKMIYFDNLFKIILQKLFDKENEKPLSNSRGGTTRKSIVRNINRNNNTKKYNI